MSRRALSLRAILASASAAAASTALAACSRCGADANAVDLALLFSATSLLGAVWALRHRFGGREGPGSCASAAVVPVVAIALLSSPRLIVGAPLARTTVAASLFVAPLVEAAWSRWIAPADRGARPLRAALTGAPLAGLALSIDPPLLAAAGFVAAAAVAALSALRVRHLEESELALAAHVDGITLAPDGVTRPPRAGPMDPRLERAAAAIDARVDDVAASIRRDREARDEVDEARALRTRFMAVMSHELRSPLNSILGFTSVLQRGIDGELADAPRESVSMIHHAAHDLSMLLTDVLDLAKLEAGRLELDLAWTPSVEILTESIARGQAVVRGQDVRVEAELEPGLPPVHVDAPRVVQAVVALFRNAAAPLRRATIRLVARRGNGPPGPPRQLRVEIHDAMGALPAAEVEKIFEAFQEITEPTGRRLGGLGMALTLSRGIVRLHGGEVWAQPRDGGTVLCIALPLSE